MNSVLMREHTISCQHCSCIVAMSATYFAQDAADLAVRSYMQYKIYVKTRLVREHSCTHKLFKLVLSRLRKLELAQSTNFNIPHCLGQRMKAKGADGASRSYQAKKFIPD